MSLFFDIFPLCMKSAAAQKSVHIVLEEKLISVIQQCKSIQQVYQIQTQLTTHGLQHNYYTTPHLLTKASQLTPITYARKLFDKLPDRANASLWNPLLKGYLHNHQNVHVLALFRQMRRDAVVLNCYTCPLVVKASVGILDKVCGEEVHCYTVKSGWGGNSYVGTGLIEFYAQMGVIEDAYKVFRDMSGRNVVSWTAMVKGYLVCGDLVSARRVFELAPERDVVLWNSMVMGYVEAGDMVGARRVFDEMPLRFRDVMCWNSVLGGYASSGDVWGFEKFFEEMPERNVYSWNLLLGGYARSGLYNEVLSVFKKMLDESDVVPSESTFSTVLSVCGKLGALEFGNWVRGLADGKGCKGNVSICNALIDMYAKCGVIGDSIGVFNGMETKDVVTWNTMLGGLAMHGRGADALSLFDEMKNAGEMPNGVTFIAILSACTHMGFVEDGISFFQLMKDEYKIVPQIEHYGCMIDLLAKAGELDRAMDFLRKMPMEADAVIWAALLGSCRIHKNVELAEVALERLNELEPNNPANFVMLSNIYGDAGMWKDLARLKSAIRDTKSKKVPGYSLIEINDHVSKFYSLDENNPESQQIYELIMVLREMLKSFGYVPDIDCENMNHL